MARKPKSASLARDPEDLTLGELIEIEQAGGELPASVQAAMVPLTRLFRNISHMTRPWDSQLGPRAGGKDVAAGPRALALALLPAARMPEPPPAAPARKSRVRHSKAWWQKRRQDVLDLRAKGKKPGEAERQVARSHRVDPETLHARIHSRRIRSR
jgi:hypothetical protein